jgi:hypothetical protein
MTDLCLPSIAEDIVAQRIYLHERLEMEIERQD